MIQFIDVEHWREQNAQIGEENSANSEGDSKENYAAWEPDKQQKEEADWGWRKFGRCSGLW